MKTNITNRIEYALFDYYHVLNSKRCALEVPMVGGRVDLVALEGDVITCVEIKTSYSDFKSKNGHNFFGNKNYYAVPLDLYEKVKSEIDPHIGIIVVNIESTIYHSVRVARKAKLIKHQYPKDFINRIKENMWISLVSNVRRLLRDRAYLSDKLNRSEQP